MTRHEPEPWISQTEHKRVAVEGRLVGGEPCTLLFVQDSDGGWQCYRFGLPGEAILLTGAEVRKIARVLGDPP